jgi:hypothetical protein
MAEELMVEAVIWDFGGVLHVITANAGCLPLSSGAPTPPSILCPSGN